MKVGSTVELKSGGPLMTVDAINVGKNNGDAACVWFGSIIGFPDAYDDALPRFGTFAQDALTVITE